MSFADYKTLTNSAQTLQQVQSEPENNYLRPYVDVSYSFSNPASADTTRPIVEHLNSSPVPAVASVLYNNLPPEPDSDALAEMTTYIALLTRVSFNPLGLSTYKKP
ncbi:hypothetical protein FGADI_1113 [Fusarium gaditjirri]|uniref:Uncharacterized protein n=1 Tax=Fusarium gaditjirri TaxID=282569 RepID=A0A8H4X3J0_9HYPO|nr:hypothetical protein FGADI_1113 [Fusarium gaditjirri]